MFKDLEKKVDNFIKMDNDRDEDDVGKRLDEYIASHKGANDPYMIAQMQVDVKRNSAQLAKDHDEDDEVKDRVKALELELAGYRDFEDLAIAGLVLGALGFLMGGLGLGLGLTARYPSPSLSNRHVELRDAPVLKEASLSPPGAELGF